jgi:hypothetical protein
LAEDRTSKYTHVQPPQPWRDTHDLSEYDNNPDYAEEFDQSFWPPDGFFSDLRDHTLGFETTNFFSFWTAVSAIGSAIQRDAWVRFGDGLFPNFFTVLVAPPGICHKSTAMERYNKIETEAFQRMPNKLMGALKKVDIVKGKASSEQLFNSMKNRDIEVADKFNEAGEPLTIKSNATLIMRISELGVFMSNSQYNAGLVDKLTDFFDCKDHDSDSTIARGHVELENIFASLFACTTPDSLANSIPAEAFGGGFMSRCIIAEMKPEQTTRIISAPYYPPNAPSREEMADRLIWLMHEKRGEYSMTENAFDFYDKWYRTEIIKLREKASVGESDHRDNRKTQHVLKLALIMALQRYTVDHHITVEDLEYAIKAYEYTNSSSEETIEDISINGQQDGRMHKFLRIIRKAGAKGIERKLISKNHNFKKSEIDKYLEELESRELIIEEGVLTVNEQGKKRNTKTFFYRGK